MIKTNNKHIYLIILIFGVIITGCISTKNNDNDTANYHDKYSKEPNFTLEINGADTYSRERILAVLNNTDSDVTKYILSVSIVQKIEKEQCVNTNATGCVSANFTTNGKLVGARVYILDRNTYKGGTCYAFDHILYHEIGHVVYFYNFGNYGIDKKDKFYQEALETYADRYADEHSKTDQVGCDEDVVKQLEQISNEKQSVYQYATKILSKWDKYKDAGIPESMKDEYLFDYYAYLDAKKEYTEALNKLEDYSRK